MVVERHRNVTEFRYELMIHINCSVLWSTDQWLFVGVVFNFQLHDDLLNRFRFILRIKSTRSIHLSASLQHSPIPPFLDVLPHGYQLDALPPYSFAMFDATYVDNDIVQVMTASCHCICRCEQTQLTKTSFVVVAKTRHKKKTQLTSNCPFSGPTWFHWVYYRQSKYGQVL